MKIKIVNLLGKLSAILGVVSIVFFLFTILPGDPAQMMLDQNENSEQLNIIKQKFGFDLPLSQQYLFYLNDLSPLSFHSKNENVFSFYSKEKYGGMILFSIKKNSVVLKLPYMRTSYQKRGKKVSTIIKETLFNTFVLAVSAISIAIILGIILGTLSAIFKNSFLDRGLMFISTIGISVPSFFSAILFSWFFGFVLNKYTGLNMTGSLFELDDFGESNRIMIKNLILPAFVLGIRPLVVILQLMRNSLLDELDKEYIQTARSKGLPFFKIIRKHAFKNSLNPLITVVSGWFASLLAGAVFVEYIFGWKGLGKEIVTSLNTLDIPVLMGAVITISFIFILINIIVDLFYSFVDPRINK